MVRTLGCCRVAEGPEWRQSYYSPLIGGTKTVLSLHSIHTAPLAIITIAIMAVAKWYMSSPLLTNHGPKLVIRRNGSPSLAPVSRYSAYPSSAAANVR